MTLPTAREEAEQRESIAHSHGDGHRSLPGPRSPTLGGDFHTAAAPAAASLDTCAPRARLARPLGRRAPGPPPNPPLRSTTPRGVGGRKRPPPGDPNRPQIPQVDRGGAGTTPSRPKGAVRERGGRKAGSQKSPQLHPEAHRAPSPPQTEQRPRRAVESTVIAHPSASPGYRPPFCLAASPAAASRPLPRTQQTGDVATRHSSGAERSRFFPAVAGRRSRASARLARSEREVQRGCFLQFGFSLKPKLLGEKRLHLFLPYTHSACTKCKRAAVRQLGSHLETAAGEDKFIST